VQRLSKPSTVRSLVRSRAGWTAAATLAAASVALVLWARTRPSFDAYGWLVWGHQTLAGALNTNAAPSWKPLPYVFTVPYALFGHYELWLWMVTSVAISLAGTVFAGRIAYRVTRSGAGAARWAAICAGVFAGAALLLIQDWWHYMLSAQSDTMVVAFCLAAVDSHLSGRPRLAYVLGAFAALGRPEVWPMLGLYALWAWRAVPGMRWTIVLGVVAIVLLWFGIPALTSRSPFVAASNALGSGRRLRTDQIGGTVSRFLVLNPVPLQVAAAVSACWAAIRRDRGVLALAAGVVLWVAIEVAFALHGWPGLGRYMFGAAGLTLVLAAVLFGRLLGSAGQLRSSAPARWFGVALAVALLAAVIPSAISAAQTERRNLLAQHLRTTEIDRLASTVSALGGPGRLRACGEPLTHLEYQTVLAWTLHVNVAAIGFKYGRAIRRGRPLILYTPVPSGGWQVEARYQRSPRCLTLPR
jgi:hypothetical protein